MPTRGAAPYIGEAIDSVLAQTHEDWTLLISENGPGGGELEERLAPYLADPRIRYSATGKDLGAAANHTRLIQDGSAPYVAVLHDDDRWDPGFLARRVEFLERHQECGLVFSGNREIDEHSSVTGQSKQVVAEGVHAPTSFAPLLLRHNPIGIPTVLVRRSAYEAVGPAFDDETVFFDYEMWIRLALRFPVGYLAVADADYRVHRQQVTMTARRRGEQQLRLLDQIDGLLAATPGVEPDRRQLRRRRAGAHLSAALDALQDPNRRAAGRHLARALRTHPPAAVDPRTAATLVGLAVGARGRRALDRLRFLVLRKGLRVHLRR
jgi:glycosyltransferase involved in cell wall biosynthesis